MGKETNDEHISHHLSDRKIFSDRGGVSKDNQWLALTLAQAGFRVHVVTNAEEIEPPYRCLAWSGFSMPPLPDHCSGSITVHRTTKAERRHYIPYANPYVTKLASIATKVIRTYRCDLIYSYYLEPYAVAAFLAAQWTGIPYGLRHAGSDVGSLFQSPELRPAYCEVIRAADYLLATPSTWRGFLHLGVPPDKLYAPAGSALPACFALGTETLEVNALVDWLRQNLPPDPYYEVFRATCEKRRRFRADLPTIGMYGKVGPVKGSFDLLNALGLLQREGMTFQFLTLAQGNFLADFAREIEAQGLTEQTWLLPFLPHWDVPRFLRACTAVCFLERDFPIKIHTPLIPLEVFACGTPLVLSHEVAEKQSYREHLQHGENVYLVDPHNHHELAAVLKSLLQDPSASGVGMRGYHITARVRERFAAAAQGWPRQFLRMFEDIQQRRQMMSLAEMQTCLAQLYTDDAFRTLFALAPETAVANYRLTEEEKQALKEIDQRLLEAFATSLKMKQVEYLRAAYPATFALPQDLMQRWFNRFSQFYPVKPQEDLFARILTFGEYLEQVLPTDEQAPGYASEVVRYERVSYFHTYQPRAEDAFTAINADAEEAPLHLQAVLLLRPGIGREVFAYPIVQIVEALAANRAPDDQITRPERCELVFVRDPHSLTLKVFSINEETALLLDLCQQERTIAGIVEAVEHHLGETGLADDILAMLAALQTQKMIEVR